MALPTSGRISHGDIKGEFGGTGAVGLSNYYGATGGIPTSGTIKESDFYGKSAAAGIYDKDITNFVGTSTNNAPDSWKNDGGSYKPYNKSGSYPGFFSPPTNYGLTGMTWPYDEVENIATADIPRYWAWEERKISQYMKVEFAGGMGKTIDPWFGPSQNSGQKGAPKPLAYRYGAKKGDNGYVQGNIPEMENDPMSIEMGGDELPNEATKITWHVTGEGSQGNSGGPYNGSFKFIGSSGTSYGTLPVSYGAASGTRYNATISMPISEGTGKIQYNGYKYSSGYIAPLNAYIYVNKVEVS